jgi:PAS domain S-box-containing protein
MDKLMKKDLQEEVTRQHQELQHLRAAIQQEADARRQAEAQRVRFLSLTIQALCVTDLEGRLVEVSPACESTLGCPAEALVGRFFLSFLHPQDKSSLRDQMRNLAAGVPTASLEIRWRCGDNSYKWLSWEATLDRTERRTFAILRDTSERRSMEDALAEERHLLATMRNFAGLLADTQEEASGTAKSIQE